MISLNDIHSLNINAYSTGNTNLHLRDKFYGLANAFTRDATQAKLYLRLKSWFLHLSLTQTAHLVRQNPKLWKMILVGGWESLVQRFNYFGFEMLCSRCIPNDWKPYFGHFYFHFIREHFRWLLGECWPYSKWQYITVDCVPRYRDNLNHLNGRINARLFIDHIKFD